MDNNNKSMLSSSVRAYICGIAYINDPNKRIRNLQSVYDLLFENYVVTATRERFGLLNDRQFHHIMCLLREGKDIMKYAKSRLNDAQQAQVDAYVTAHDKSMQRYREARDEAEELYQKHVADYYKHRHTYNLGYATYGDSCQLNEVRSIR